MQVNYSVPIRGLVRRMIILLLTLSLISSIAFLGLAWLSGKLQTPAFLLSSQSGNVPTRLIVDVQPNDATITLNDQQFKNGDSLIPGEYTVKVTRESYYSVQETFRVHPSQENHLSIRLMPIVTTQEIAHYATSPGWDTDGELYFLDGSEGKIYKWMSNILSIIVDTVDGTYQLTYTPDGTQAFALAVTGPESESRLYMIDLKTGSATDLVRATGFSLGADGKTVWGFNYNAGENVKPFWSIEPGRSPKPLSLENSQWEMYGDRLSVDSSSQWLAVESTKGVAVWEIASGKLLVTFKNASAPVWIQNPEPGLAFLNTDHALNFAQANFNWSVIKLLENVQSPIAGTAGGNEIIFTRYNPFVGGTSFWAIDTITMSVRLLSEAKTESGRVDQFVMSFDGKKIAFVNQKNTLFLVTLEP